MKVDEWKKNNQGVNIYFRAYKKIEKGSCEGDGREDVSEFEQPLLWIHQEA